MRDFVIFGDSTCDLDLTLRQQYNIDYIAMNYIVDDQEYPASLDWESHGVQSFYDLMRQGKRVFTTQVPQNVLQERFRSVLESGKDVLYIACSSALSASVKAAQLVGQELEAQYPGSAVCCVDSLISSLGQGYLLMEASRKRDQGMDARQTAAYIESIRLRVNQCGTVASLEYLRRAGRVKASKAFFGNLFGVKPLIISDIRGQNYAFKKAKGNANARAAIAEHIVDAAQGVYDELYLTHADCSEEIELLKQEILARAPFRNVTVGYIGPIVGASVGPGTVIAFVFGKEVTIEGNE